MDSGELCLGWQSSKLAALLLLWRLHDDHNRGEHDHKKPPHRHYSSDHCSAPCSSLLAAAHAAATAALQEA
jgi:hypothetical protein